MQPYEVNYRQQFPLCDTETEPPRYHLRLVGHLKWDLWHHRFKGVYV